MPKGYNSLNTYVINSLEVGICPTCCRRLSAECEHGGGWEREQWYAAWIVAEQLGVSPQRDPAVIDAQEAVKSTSGATQQLPKSVSWDEAMQGRERDFNRRYYNNPDGEPKFPHEVKS